MNHTSIRVSTLRGDSKINFDVFVKINEKMIHYLRRGDSFEGTRLKRLKEKKLKNLYILVEDEPHYRTYLKTNIDSAYDPNSKKDVQTRAEIIQGDQQSRVEDVFENPENKEFYLGTKTASHKFVEFLTKNSLAAAAVLKIENSDKNLAHHGVTVATLAVALSHKMKQEDQKVIQWLTFGSLLHDIGLHETPVVYTQPLNLLSPEDLKLYRGHPHVGIEKLKNTEHFDPQVLKIINEHEECLDGSGYPKGMLEKQLDPLSIIVATCNAMDRLLTFEAISKTDAPKRLMIDQVGKHPLDQIKLLSEIIKSL
ncbi:MAG: HDIG domain-containing protein [Bdellovibrionaceae bacterium]|nr:HDIG domain-containing protein [Pseudobdellovibrionaceae bacterium]